MKLNPQQELAVTHRDGPLLVLAGAGTGKTRVITQRIARLLEQGVRPGQILAVTFTNKAAGEMRARIERQIEEGNTAAVDPRHLWIGTFHSICARILRQYATDVGLTRNFGIYDTGDQKTLMSRVFKDLSINIPSFTPQNALWRIDQAKNRGCLRADARYLEIEEPQRTAVATAWKEYEKRMRASDAVDFGDLLCLTLELLSREAEPGALLADFDPIARLRERFSHVVVDEFRDTNPVQAMLIERLSKRATLCVVGDDDQAIYGWRGADVQQFLGFAARHPGCEVVRLEQNYRSTQHILDCADAIIRKNHSRMGKKLWSDLGEGELVRVLYLADEREEALLIASAIDRLITEGADPEQCAVFYRTHAQSRVLEEALRRLQVHYRIVGGTRFFDRAEVKDLIAYLRLLTTPTSDLDAIRIINRPARGIGAATIDKLAGYATQEGISFLEACRNSEKAGLKTGPRRKVDAFVALYDELLQDKDAFHIAELAATVLEKTGYRNDLAAQDDVESESRLENLQEFLGSLEDFREHSPEATLSEYLEQISLATSEEGQRNQQVVSLMTVHSAKGLEFDYVFLTGMEERVFPHARSYDEPEEMEEERRLAYVAVTRARRCLTVTTASRRFLYGQDQVGRPSRFVNELPDANTERVGRSMRSPQPVSAVVSTGSSTQASPGWDSDIVRDVMMDSPDAEGVSLFVGMPIAHTKYGTGAVMGWSGGGADLKLTIRFPHAGTKTILARFCDPA